MFHLKCTNMVHDCACVTCSVLPLLGRLAPIHKTIHVGQPVQAGLKQTHS